MFAIPKEDCDHKLVIHVTVPQTVAEIILCQRHQSDLKTSMQASNPVKHKLEPTWYSRRVHELPKFTNLDFDIYISTSRYLKGTNTTGCSFST